MEGKSIYSYFKPVRFSNEVIRDSFITVPMLKEMREKYLKTSVLKLKQLDRVSDERPPETEISHYIARWKGIVNF